MEPIFEQCYFKVDQQPKRVLSQFHITQQLGFVNRQKAFDRLKLKRKPILDQEIEPEPAIETYSFVHDRQLLLAFVFKRKTSKLGAQGFFVSELVHARSQSAMHADSRSDHRPGQFTLPIDCHSFLYGPQTTRDKRHKSSATPITITRILLVPIPSVPPLSSVRAPIPLGPGASRRCAPLVRWHLPNAGNRLPDLL